MNQYDLRGRVAVVTGGAHGIGKAIAQAFAREGASVCVIDRTPNPYFTGDVGEEETLRRFAERCRDAPETRKRPMLFEVRTELRARVDNNLGRSNS